MTDRIHTLVQDADDGDAVIGRQEVDDMLPDAAPSIAGTDAGAALRLLQRFGQIDAGRFNMVDIAYRLGHIPPCHGIVEYRVEIALCPGAQPILSQIARPCAV